MTPEVMALPPDGWSTIAPGMARAFQDDPMFVAGFPASHQRLDAVEAFMRWLYRVSLLGGTVVECTPDLDAVATAQAEYGAVSFYVSAEGDQQ